MQKNMGSSDKTIRLIIAIILLVLWFTKTISGTVGYVALGIAAIFALTSFISYCPLYSIFNINTCKTDKKAS